MDSVPTRTKASCIILGVCLFVLGILCLVNPIGAAFFVTLMLGWIFVAAGIATIISFGAFRDGRSGADLFVGIVELVFGILVLIFPGVFAAYLFVALGWIILVTGLFDIYEAIMMHNVEGSKWGVWLFLGILTVVFGIITFMAPLFVAEVILIFAGCFLIYDGITEFVIGLLL